MTATKDSGSSCLAARGEPDPRLAVLLDERYSARHALRQYDLEVVQ
ncbi:hypothetical protein OG244_38110 [Streptomyces brevispora]|nr:hypothetical protein [Streptomyces brevispora]